MVKSKLITLISEKHGSLSAKDVELAVNHLITHMSDCLAEGARIEVRGFGSFSLVTTGFDIRGYPHNIILEVSAEMGIITALTFVYLFFLILNVVAISITGIFGNKDNFAYIVNLLS